MIIRKNKMIMLQVLACVTALTVTSITPMNVLATEPEEETVGDEVSYVENAETKRTDETPCQLTVTSEVPKGFGLNCFVELMRDDDDKIYRVTTTEENDYSDYIFLAAGKYKVVSSGVFGDNASGYTFSMSDKAIKLEKKDSKHITATLDQFQSVQDEIDEKSGADMETFSDYFPTGIDDVVMDEHGNLRYECSSEATGRGITAYGNAIGEYDIVIKIVKGGVIGEAKFEISADGGKTFTSSGVSGLEVPTPYGIYLDFWVENDNDEFVENDTFTTKVYETFTERHTHTVPIVLSGHPENDHDYIIQILSPGNEGVAKFELLEDEESVLIDTIPEDGRYEIEDGMTIIFANNVYAKGAKYDIKVRSNSDIVDYTPLIIMGAIVAVVVLIVYFWLLTKKDREDNYRIKVWKKKQDESVYDV